jgi:cell wall assembly regulator SMI1
VTSVTEAWVRIEDWMRRHAPASATKLAGPVAAGSIARGEAQVGLAFPAELVESLRRHDGLTEWANVLPEAAPLGVGEIVEQYRERMEIAPSVDGFTPYRPDAEAWWNALWVPFGEADGDLQVIDLRPGPGHGRVGVAPHDNPADFADAWPSLGAYLAAVADSLDTGTAVGYWYPYLTADEMLWWDLAGKTELNGEPLRPADAEL